MNVQHTILASAGMALLFATAFLAEHVKTDYDRGADFNQYKTYSREKVQTADPLWVDRIKEAAGAGADLEDSEIQPQPLKIIESARLFSTSSTPAPKSSSGEDRRVTPSQIIPARTLRILTRARQRCSITFLRA